MFMYLIILFVSAWIADIICAFEWTVVIVLEGSGDLAGIRHTDGLAGAVSNSIEGIERYHGGDWNNKRRRIDLLLHGGWVQNQRKENATDYLTSALARCFSWHSGTYKGGRRGQRSILILFLRTGEAIVYIYWVTWG